MNDPTGAKCRRPMSIKASRKGMRQLTVIVNPQAFHVNGLRYIIRSAVAGDAEALSELRLQMDGETENLDREPGEAFIDTRGFEQLIATDADQPRNLFLVEYSPTENTMTPLSWEDGWTD